MSFQWAGAAAGASDALQELLARRMEEQLNQARLEAQQQAEANRTALQQQQMAQQAAQFDANLGMQRTQEARLAAGDKADQEYRTGQLARQTAQDDIAAADRRQVGNQRAVRSMAFESLMKKTADPRTAQLMAAREGVDIGMDVLDPERASREWDRRQGVQHTNRLSEITAGRQPGPITTRDRVQIRRQAMQDATDAYAAMANDFGDVPDGTPGLQELAAQLEAEYLQELEPNRAPAGGVDRSRAMANLRDVFPRGPIGSRQPMPDRRVSPASGDPYEQYAARMRSR